MKRFFYDKSGAPRWSPYWAGLCLYILIGLVIMKPDLDVAFGPHFWRAGLWMILCPLVSAFLFYKIRQLYIKNQDGRGINTKLFGALVILMAGIFGSATAIKNDQASGVTDVLVVYANGQIVNATDPSERNWYFNYFRPNPVDSLYIVTHNEEPGINRTGYVTDSTRSVKPRADDYWTRPPSQKKIELRGKY